MSPARYFISTESNKMRALASVYALRRHYQVLDRRETPDHKGIIIATETPVAPEDQEAHGLKPFEDP